MSLANYFSRDFWSAFDLKSNLPHSIDSLFSLLLISKVLNQMQVLFLLIWSFWVFLWIKILGLIFCGGFP